VRQPWAQKYRGEQQAHPRKAVPFQRTAQPLSPVWRSGQQPAPLFVQSEGQLSYSFVLA
jgi:hypothetical protein